jgi:hypothetical protein
LEVILSENAVLEYFEFRVDPSVTREANLRVFAVRGLRHNRWLQTFCFPSAFYIRGGLGWSYVPPYESASVNGEIGEQTVAMLEERNIKLQRIDGLEYENGQHEERVNQLLELNRYCQGFVANLNAFRWSCGATSCLGWATPTATTS